MSAILMECEFISSRNLANKAKAGLHIERTNRRMLLALSEILDYVRISIPDQTWPDFFKVDGIFRLS